MSLFKLGLNSIRSSGKFDQQFNEMLDFYFRNYRKDGQNDVKSRDICHSHFPEVLILMQFFHSFSNIMNTIAEHKTSSRLIASFIPLVKIL